MNDIRLRETTQQGKYDWSFGWNDLDVVRGNMQLVNAVRHAVLLKPDELSQEVYTDKGCEAHDYVYRGNSSVEREQEEQIIENTAKEVSGVYDARCTLPDHDDYENNIELTLITEQYEEVEIDGI